MNDIRLWRKESIAELLEMYKSHPCLWRKSCKEYKNKQVKNEAYQELIEYCKHNGMPEANRDFVVKKIQSLRSSFRKELKRVTDRNREPNLWYFDLLLFTKDQEISDNLNTDDSDNDTLCIWPTVKKEDRNTSANYIYIEEDSNGRSGTSGSEESDSTPTPTPTKKRKMVRCPSPEPEPEPEPLNIYAKASNSNPKDLSEFDAVGINTAKKLAKMDPLQAIYAESLLNNVLSKGLLRKLSEDTSLCDRCNKCKK